MGEGELLRDQTINGISVLELPVVYGEGDGWLYGEGDAWLYRGYLSVVDGGGFYLRVFEFVSCEMGGENVCVQELMQVDAVSEGVKHIHFNREGQGGIPGYWYYPDIAKISELFSLIQELERKYCKKKNV